MKNKLSKIPAFTLTELLVAMAIAAVVIGLASSILNLLFMNIQFIQSNYAANTEINLLEQQLVVDFNTYHSITYNNDMELLQLNNELDSVSYKFQDSSILRKGDTILSKNYTKQVFYQGNTITTGNIDAIKLEFIESNTFIFCYKENDAFDIVATNGD